VDLVIMYFKVSGQSNTPKSEPRMIPVKFSQLPIPMAPSRRVCGVRVGVACNVSSRKPGFFSSPHTNGVCIRIPVSSLFSI
jgi:hypothetical protein